MPTREDRQDAPDQGSDRDALRRLNRWARAAWRRRFWFLAGLSLVLLGRVLFRWAQAGWTVHPGWFLECFLALTNPWVLALAHFVVFKLARFAVGLVAAVPRLWRRR